MIQIKSQVHTENEITSIIQTSCDFEDYDDLIICPALTTTQNRQYTVLINNFLEHPYTMKKGCHIATFSILTTEGAKYVKPINPKPLRHLLDTNHDDAIQYINALPQITKSKETNETKWFLTPQEPGDEAQHKSIKKVIIQEPIALQKLEQLNPQENQESRQQFLSHFDWNDSTLDTAALRAIEELLVEFHDIFARHRLDIDMNNDFNVKLTPIDESAAYSQNLSIPINLKEDITIEMALPQKNGITTRIPLIKNTCPIFAQRKANAKIHFLVDLGKIKNLISDDYINNKKTPLSTLTDAAQHMEGKNIFWNFDYSPAYYCLQMTDQSSVKMLAINFASRTFAHQRLAKGLSRSLSASSSFMREYLNPIITANQGAQYVDDICIATNSPQRLTTNLRAVFKSIQNTGLKFFMAKCHFGTNEVDFLGRTVTPNGDTPQKQKITCFSEKVKRSRFKKALMHYIGFLNHNQNHTPRLPGSLNFFLQLLKTPENKDKIIITTVVMKEFRESNDV